MQTLAERFFTGAEQQRITAAVQAVEARTSGEVVVMVTSASHGYPEAGLLAAAALALPAALATAFTTAGLLWWRGEVLWLFLLLFTLFVLVLRPLVSRFPALLRLFLRRDRLEAEVVRAAFTHFFTEGLHTTPGRTSVVTTACATKSPRSLRMRSRAPSAMPRAAASSGWISSLGPPSSARKRAWLAKVELRKLRAGGVISASG